MHRLWRSRVYLELDRKFLEGQQIQFYQVIRSIYTRLNWLGRFPTFFKLSSLPCTANLQKFGYSQAVQNQLAMYMNAKLQKQYRLVFMK